MDFQDNQRRADYTIQTEKCVNFLKHYSNLGNESSYQEQLQGIVNRTNRIFEVNVDDILDFEGNDDLAKEITSNTRRYVSLFSQAIDECMKEMRPTAPLGPADVFDVLTQHRTRQVGEGGALDDAQSQAPGIPADLTRRYEVRFIPATKEKPVAIRSVRAAQIGHLVTVNGIVTRVSDVKPMISVATYVCDQCGYEIYQEVKSQTFMPLLTCPSDRCKENKTSGKLHMQTRGSKFIKFQDVKLQEMSEHVPIGHVPRTISIHVTGELTSSASAGDIVSVTGVFLPVPHTGFKGMRPGLTADTFIEAMKVSRHKKNYTEYTVSEEVSDAIAASQERGEDMYTMLSQSIAPEIFGHEDVKKALLVLLVGGITRNMSDGMKIRGDINVCLIGDPGVAKSQLLKHVSTLAPRAIYTTGKGSSGVGLTAAVMRDPFTNELVLEGGALVLADMGICCIDEFDKMEDSDRTAIHEVMEQQTVSIAKGGITTTLNARTSVLAAANPAYGRYNLKRAPSENIGLPAALLSRFDLLFLLLDKADYARDEALARHVTHVHRHNTHPELGFSVLNANFMRQYIAAARQITPHVPEALTEHLVSIYVTMRQDDADDDSYMYTSARTLLAVLRISQALARLRFSEEVSVNDVEEASRLMQCSKLSLIDEDQTNKDQNDASSAIYDTIRDLAMLASATGKSGAQVKFKDFVDRVIAKGYSHQQINDCVESYERLNVWQTDVDKTVLTFIDSSA